MNAVDAVVVGMAVGLTVLGALFLLWHFGKWVYVAFNHHPDHDIVAARKRRLERLCERHR